MLNRETSLKNHEGSMMFKEEVASHYGGKCSCCGETTIEFLLFHHSRLDGAEHRRKMVLEKVLRDEWESYFKLLGWTREAFEDYAEKKAGLFPERIDIWLWAKENDYPQDIGLILLCANCHTCVHSKYIICPHQRKKSEATNTPQTNPLLA